MLDQTLNGLSYGAIYAALALAIVLTWRASRSVNFALGGLAMLTTYLADTALQHGTGYWAALAIALAAGLLLGAGAEVLLVRRAARSGPIGTVAVTIGLLILVEAVAGMIWGGGIRSFRAPFSVAGLHAGKRVIALSSFDLYVLAAVAVGLIALTALFRFTALGLRMRATAFHAEVARLLGVRVGRILTLSWALAAVFGSLAGVLVAPKVFLAPTSMDGALIYAFTAAVIGGLDSAVGAVVGGLVLGLVTSYVGAWSAAGPSLEVLGAFVLLIAVLMVRPQGLFGGRGRRWV